MVSQAITAAVAAAAAGAAAGAATTTCCCEALHRKSRALCLQVLPHILPRVR